MKKYMISVFLLTMLFSMEVSASAEKGSGASSAEPTQKPDYSKIIAATSMMNISLLNKEAAEGKMDSALAAYDFSESLKDPNYKITYPGSKARLRQLDLIDVNGNIHQSIRDALSNQFCKK